MKITTVKLSDVTKHPAQRLDPAYWIGLQEDRKSYKQVDGFYVEDINGPYMLTEDIAKEINSTKLLVRELHNHIKLKENA